MTTVSIMQPHYLPWIGYFELIRLSDYFVHFDDVQIPQGRSFFSRVKIPTITGEKWLTIPLDKTSKYGNIKDAVEANSEWRQSHLTTLRESYKEFNNFDSLRLISEEIYSNRDTGVSEFNINAIERLAQDLDIPRQYFKSSNFGFKSSSSKKILDICRIVNADVYLTGHGAMNYLDSEMLEKSGVEVRFIDYRWKKHHKMTSESSPFFSIVNLLANSNMNLNEIGESRTVNWRNFSIPEATVKIL